MAEQHRSRRRDFLRKLFHDFPLRLNFEMLRSDEIRDGRGLVRGRGEHGAETRLHDFAKTRAFRAAREQSVDRGADFLMNVRVERDEIDFFLPAPVFRLRDDVSRYPFGVRGSVRDHHHFARPRQQIDADFSEKLPLRLDDERVPGTGDFVDGSDRFRAASHRRDRLNAADRVNFGNAAKFRRGENFRRDASVRVRRRANHQFGNAGELRRNRRHQHRRAQRNLAARNVKPDAPNRVKHFPDDRALRIFRLPVFPQRPRVKIPNGFRRRLHRGEFFRSQRRTGGVDRLRGNAKLSRRQFRAVELLRIAQHGGVAVRGDVRDDVRHDRRNFSRQRGGSGEFFQLVETIRVFSGYLQHFFSEEKRTG